MLNLMSPGEIGSLKLKNRIVMAPMGPHFGDIDARPWSISPPAPAAGRP